MTSNLYRQNPNLVITRRKDESKFTQLSDVCIKFSRLKAEFDPINHSQIRSNLRHKKLNLPSGLSNLKRIKHPIARVAKTRHDVVFLV